jgi:two-component system phosphate regulon sensor histidine kinase PhoR
MSGFWEEEGDDGWRKLAARLDEKTRHIWAIDSVSQAISSALSMEELLRVSLERVVDVTGASAGGVYVTNADGMWRLASSYNLPEPIAPRYLTLDPQSPLISMALKGPEPVTWDVVMGQPDLHPTGPLSVEGSESVEADEGDLRALAAVAMFALEVAQAILVLYTLDRQALSPANLEMLRVIGHLTGLAMANTVAHEQALKRADTQLEIQLAEMEAVLGSISEGLLICDEEGRIIRANSAAEQATGIPISQLIGQSLLSPIWNRVAGTVPPEDEVGVEEEGPLARVILHGEALKECLIEIDGDEGRRVLRFSAAPIMKSDGITRGTVAMVRDVTKEQRAQQVQDEFLSLISHELRAPLTVISGYAQILSRKLARKGLPEEAGSAELIKMQANRMSAMVGDMVESGRLEGGLGDITLEEINLGELVESIVARIMREQHQHRDKHIITLSVEPGLPPALADARRLDQVVTNLLSNALRYSPDGGQIQVEVKCGGANCRHDNSYSQETNTQAAVVSVVDEGIGIPPEEREHVFDRAFRGIGARTISAQGLGLGLYICQLIVEAHGGRIGVTEGPGGRGSHFWFTVPLAQDKRWTY